MNFAEQMDRLNSLWKQAEQQLADFRIDVPVQVPTDNRVVLLGYRKVGERWRICVGEFDHTKNAYQWVPIAEAGKEYRIELSKFYPGLKTTVKDAQDRLPSRVQAAIDNLEGSVFANTRKGEQR